MKWCTFDLCVDLTLVYPNALERIECLTTKLNSNTLHHRHLDLPLLVHHIITARVSALVLQLVMVVGLVVVQELETAVVVEHSTTTRGQTMVAATV